MRAGLVLDAAVRLLDRGNWGGFQPSGRIFEIFSADIWPETDPNDSCFCCDARVKGVYATKPKTRMEHVLVQLGAILQYSRRVV